MSLDAHAGVDTWYGPRPDECCNALALAQRAARGAVTDLRVQAQRFDDTAAQLDAEAFAAERAAEEARSTDHRRPGAGAR